MRAPIVPTGTLWFGRNNEGKSRVNAKVCDREALGPVATLGSDAHQANESTGGDTLTMYSPSALWRHRGDC
jgi:hypothetical protein